MRLDHIAYRVKDRRKTAKFFEEAFGYEVGTEFQIEFNDGSKADCMALVPPEDRPHNTERWIHKALLYNPVQHLSSDRESTIHAEFHSPPEIFVSDGSEGSIVGDWVVERGGIGGVHHIAYQVENVEEVMNEWKEKGYAEFYSDKPIVCRDPDLTQVFSKPSELTGVVYELITREGDGFCKDSVKALMESTHNVNEA